MSNTFVVLMGIGTVFVGLICIIIICKILGAICTAFIKEPQNNASAQVTATPAAQPIENRQEIVAAVCAAIAEELGTDISAVRVLSFKKI